MTGRVAVAVLGALALAASAAWAQLNTPPGRIVPVLEIEPEHSLSQHPIPALSDSQKVVLEQARALRSRGQLRGARDLLLGLLAQQPHHALILTELATLDLAQQDYGQLERLARAERASQRDSLLLARQVELALERLGRNREAAQIAIEAWSAEPAEGNWASETALRLASTDPRGIRDAMRRAVDARPERVDLVEGLARLEWQLGDIGGALHALTEGERAGVTPSLRWRFADRLLLQRSTRDTAGAIDVLLDLAGDDRQTPAYRVVVAHRVWDLERARQAEAEDAPRLQKALKDVPVASWTPDLLAGVARGLRLGGRTSEARELLQERSTSAPLPPALALEAALADLREGPPERALASLKLASKVSSEAAFRFAEALFYAGLSDSALHLYERVASNPRDPFAGAALERIYLIEDAKPPTPLATFGRIAYEDWRGNDKLATTLAESLYAALPRGPLWAQAAVLLSRHLDARGDLRPALAPLLAVADSLPDDRLAPLARQLAGGLYVRLKDDAAAVSQYEECLARYPRAWNAAEVRRQLETLRQERRF